MNARQTEKSRFAELVLQSFDEYILRNFVAVCSIECFFLEEAPNTYRMTAEACNLEKFICSEASWDLVYSMQLPIPIVSILFDLMQREEAYCKDFVNDYANGDCRRKHDSLKLNEAVSIAKFSREGIVDLYLQFDPSSLCRRRESIWLHFSPTKNFNKFFYSAMHCLVQ